MNEKKLHSVIFLSVLTEIAVFCNNSLHRFLVHVRKSAWSSLRDICLFKFVPESSEIIVLKLSVKGNTSCTSALRGACSASPWFSCSESPVFALENTSYLLVGIFTLDSCGVNRWHRFYSAPFFCVQLNNFVVSEQRLDAWKLILIRGNTYPFCFVQSIWSLFARSMLMFSSALYQHWIIFIFNLPWILDVWVTHSSCI